MNVQEMHNVFRVLGQQMGMQLIRGILPESIDVYLNNSIIETVQQELLMGVRTPYQDNINTQSSTINPVNIFRHLYRTVRYKLNKYPNPEDNKKVNRLTQGTNNDEGNNDEGTGSQTQKVYKVSYCNYDNGFHIVNIPTINTTVDIEDGEYRISPMIYLGFSIEYEDTLRGNPIACRLIGSDILETTLRDYCNAADKNSPIVCLNSIPNIDTGNEISSYGIANEQLEIYINTKNTHIRYLNIKYIKTPNVVKYDVNIDDCVNCDLPSYTHYGIVERAVQKFYQSVGATSGQQKQQQQMQ